MVKLHRNGDLVFITLESEEEIDLFYHIVNYSPRNESGWYSMAEYRATFKQLQDFKTTLWEMMDKVHHTFSR